MLRVRLAVLLGVLFLFYFREDFDLCKTGITNTVWNRMCIAKQNSCSIPRKTKTANKEKQNFTSPRVCRLGILACIIIFKHISSRRKKFAIKTALRQYKVNKNIENGIVITQKVLQCWRWHDWQEHNIWLSVSRIRQIRLVLIKPVELNKWW